MLQAKETFDEAVQVDMYCKGQVARDPETGAALYEPNCPHIDGERACYRLKIPFSDRRWDYRVVRFFAEGKTEAIHRAEDEIRKALALEEKHQQANRQRYGGWSR